MVGYQGEGPHGADNCLDRCERRISIRFAIIAAALVVLLLGALPLGANAAAGSAASEKAEVNSMRFGASQYYDGKVYIGDLRTNMGDKRVADIPDSHEPPVSVERFLFVDGTYFYLENFIGNGSGPVMLHELNMATGDDKVISENVLASYGSSVFYEDGVIAFRSISSGKGSGLSVLDIATGKETKLADGSMELLGLYDGACYACAHEGLGKGCVIKRYPIAGGKPDEFMSFGKDVQICGIFEGTLLTLDGKSCTAYDLGARELWSGIIPDGLSMPSFQGVYCSNGVLYYVAGSTSAGNEHGNASRGIIRLSLENGKSAQYQTGLPSVMAIMYADDDTVYFCAKEDVSGQAMANGDFSTFACSLSDGEITKLGEQVG